MADFTLSEHDQAILTEVRRQALICREHARYHDEHEVDFVPDQLPDAAKEINPFALLAKSGPQDTQIAVMGMLIGAGQAWGYPL